MFTRTLLIAALAAALAVVDHDLGQPDMARKVAFSGDGLVIYNGHAGLGASVYQHNQTDLEFLAFS